MSEHDRSKYIGSSDVAALLGVSPWKTRLDVYLEKTGAPVPVDQKKELIFRRGKLLEPYVLDVFEIETGLEIVSRNQRFFHQKIPFFTAEIDAIATGGVPVEVKTASPFSAKEWGEEGSGEIPVYYAAQVMASMAITGAKEVIIAACIGFDDFRVYQLQRDEPTIKAIERQVIAFWEAVQNKQAPAPVNESDILRLYGVSEEGFIEGGEKEELALLDMRSATEQVKELERQISQCKLILQQKMQEKEVLVINGRPACTWKTQIARRVSIEILKNEYPEIADICTQESSSRVFRVKGMK